MTLFLVMCAVALVASFFAYRKGLWYLLCLRALAMAMLLALLLNPAVSSGKSPRPRVVVIADVSPSMASVLGWEDSLVGRLGGVRAETRLILVSDRVLDPQRPLAMDSSASTDLSAGFAEAADAYVLLSDGLHNAPTDVSPRAPVLAFLPPKKPGFNLSVVGLDAPRSVQVGQEFTASLRYLVSGGQWRGRVVARWGAETILDSSLVLPWGSGRVTLRPAATKEGPTRLSASFIPEGDESSVADNSSFSWVEVERSGFSIQLVAARPWPDAGAIRRSLAGVPGVSVQAFVRVALGQWREMVGDTVVPSQGPGTGADAVVLVAGSSAELSPYRGKSPALIFLYSDSWGIPGVSEYQGTGFYLAPGPSSPVPDSILEDLPPVERFWRVPPQQAQDVLLSAGQWPLVFARQGDVFVASSYLWAQDVASGGEVTRAIVSWFVEKALSGKVRLSAWTGRGFAGQAFVVQAEARLPDGTGAQGVWPRIAGRPMSRTGEGLFASGPISSQSLDTTITVDFYKGNELIGSHSVRVERSPYPAESLDYGVDTGFIDRLARSTGGKIVQNPAQVAEFIRSLAAPAAPGRLRDYPWLLLLPVALLGLEWGIRRYRGTP